MPEAKRIDKVYKGIPHAELPYEIRNILNLAVNHRIQSTGASIVNRSAIAFYKNCKLAGIDCKLVVQVHDSLVVECFERDADNVALLLEDAMVNTVHLEGKFADQDSMRFAIASILLHADSSKGSLPKHYFISRLRKSAANQIASQVFQDIKTKQQEAQVAAVSKPVEATTQPSVVANETPSKN
ncbi:unnamed protein product [Sphagnum balticum]